MVKDDPVHLETARYWQALLREADRMATHLPPATVSRIEDRSDPDIEVEALIGSWMYVSKSARRQISDMLDWLVDVAREHVAESGELPALSVVRAAAR